MAVEEEGGDGRSEVVHLRQLSDAEVIAPLWGKQDLPPGLPEHDHDKAVDSH